MPEQSPLMRVVQAAQAYRRSCDAAARYQKSPPDPRLWFELCAALDALALVGAEVEIRKLDAA